jgi:hypothetical protein
MSCLTRGRAKTAIDERGFIKKVRLSAKFGRRFLWEGIL